MQTLAEAIEITKAILQKFKLEEIDEVLKQLTEDEKRKIAEEIKEAMLTIDKEEKLLTAKTRTLLQTGVKKKQLQELLTRIQGALNV